MGACPCGCGRNTGFLKKRTATHAVDLRFYLPIVHRLGEVAPRLPSGVRAGFESETGGTMAKAVPEMARSIEDICQRLLAAAHGEPNADRFLPSLRELNLHRTLGNVCASLVATYDNAWWVAHRAAQHATAQRLLDSMAFAGNSLMGSQGFAGSVNVAQAGQVQHYPEASRMARGATETDTNDLFEDDDDALWDVDDDESWRAQSEVEWTRMIDESRWEDINDPDEFTPWLRSDLLKPLVRHWARLWDAGTLFAAQQMYANPVLPLEQEDLICAAALRQAIERIRQLAPDDAAFIHEALSGSFDRNLEWCEFTGAWAWQTLVAQVKSDWEEREPEFAADPFRGMHRP